MFGLNRNSTHLARGRTGELGDSVGAPGSRVVNALLVLTPWDYLSLKHSCWIFVWSSGRKRQGTVMTISKLLEMSVVGS